MKSRRKARPELLVNTLYQQALSCKDYWKTLPKDEPCLTSRNMDEILEQKPCPPPARAQGERRAGSLNYRNL